MFSTSYFSLKLLCLILSERESLPQTLTVFLGFLSNFCMSLIWAFITAPFYPEVKARYSEAALVAAIGISGRQ